MHSRKPALLPQLSRDLFLTDGGLETSLIFLERVNLPLFAACDLLRTSAGADVLWRYFAGYAELALRHGTGLVLESATWRASPDFGERLGYSRAELLRVNRLAIEQLLDLKSDCETPESPVVVSGCIGPRGDGYVPERRMSAAEAATYHSAQARALSDAGAELISAITMNDPLEAIGIARAARAVGLPAVISFTVETDGRLPTGHSLGEAIAEVDAATELAPAYYMINCAHPDHFQGALLAGETWAGRVRGLRANASRRSHAELNDAPDLDAGDPKELGLQHRALRERLPHLNVLGGCCGTDLRHVEQIAIACAGAAAS